MANNSDNGSSPPNDNSSSDSSASDETSWATTVAADGEEDATSPPPPSSSPPPPSKDSSPPPPDNKDSPPSDNSGDNNSPSPPSDSNNKSPPPPSGNDNKSPPPPSDNDNKSPPPPSNNNENKSPPPPSGNNENKSPAPPSGNNNPPPNNNNNNSNNNNNNNHQSPPTPQSNNQNKSPTPPNSHDSSSGAHSPPPPHSPSSNSDHSTALAPPKAKSSPSSQNKSVKEDSGAPSTEMIIGVAAGLGLLLLVMIVLVVSCCRRKKRKPHNQMHYYDGSQGNRPSDYYNTSGGAWHHQGPPSDHVVKMPMPHSAAVSSEHGWAAGPPPPPPPMMSSSELSSAAFSGPFQAPPPPPPGMALGMNQSNFSYDDLAAATGGFAQSNLLGQGGFGYVHKGVLPNGLEVAVKSLKSNSGQGEREFQAEVDIISRVHHKHLVSLVGYCIAGNQRMLVYEFVPNKTLEYHLYGAGRPTMEWPTRIKIALGSAKGFAYLHEDCHPRIIHRDIKAANILLDENMEAKVADFGLAKLSSDTHTHVSTRIMGTFGYLAPEYASSGKLTEKSDVYSYGVMLLELITGRRPIDMSRDDDDSLIDWARPILARVMDGGSYEELVDPRLEGNYDHQEMLRMVACAAACIRHSARRRPKMSQIVRALEGDVSLEDLNEGVKPGHSSVFGSSGSSEYDTNSYNAEMKNFRKTGLSSQEFTSSEHGTGEFVRSVGDSQEIRPNGTRGMRN